MFSPPFGGKLFRENKLRVFVFALKKKVVCTQHSGHCAAKNCDFPLKKKRSLSLQCLQCVPHTPGFMPEEGPASCHPAMAFQTSPCQMGYYKKYVTCSKTAN